MLLNQFLLMLSCPPVVCLRLCLFLHNISTMLRPTIHECVEFEVQKVQFQGPGGVKCADNSTFRAC